MKVALTISTAALRGVGAPGYDGLVVIASPDRHKTGTALPRLNRFFNVGFIFDRSRRCFQSSIPYATRIYPENAPGARARQ